MIKSLAVTLVTGFATGMWIWYAIDGGIDLLILAIVATASWIATLIGLHA